MSAKLSTTSSSVTFSGGSPTTLVSKGADLGVEVIRGVPTPAGAIVAKAACTLAGVIRPVCSAAIPR